MDREIVHQCVPKTGTVSSIKFYTGCVRHGSKTGFPRLNQNITKGKNVVSFTIIRNPLDRFLSCVGMFLRIDLEYNQDEIIDICLNHNFSIDELASCEYLVGTREKGKKIECMIAIHSISIFHPFLNVFDENKKLKADHLIDFKNMIADLAAIIPEYDYSSYPRLNASASSELSLTDNQMERFEMRYAEDIEFYNSFVRIKHPSSVGDGLTHPGSGSRRLFARGEDR